jgi:hypothetical protein
MVDELAPNEMLSISEAAYSASCPPIRKYAFVPSLLKYTLSVFDIKAPKDILSSLWIYIFS